MSESTHVTLQINGVPVSAPQGSTVSVAILLAGAACRTSVTGEARAPLCGMGICFECRAVVNGIEHRRTCQLECREDMQVMTQS